MNTIKHVLEPKRLLLAWQSQRPDDRARRVVAELCRDDKKVMMRYLTETADFIAAKEAGFIGMPAFKIRSEEHRDRVLEILVRRLPPRSRSDFSDYLIRHRLPSDAQLSDFALLGYTEAKLPSDGFSIVNDYFDAAAPFEFLTEIAGFRYYDGMGLSIPDVIGQKVNFRPENENIYDAQAVSVWLQDRKIGYINRIQAPKVRSLLNSNSVHALIDRIEGASERPRVYLFLEIS